MIIYLLIFIVLLIILYCLNKNIYESFNNNGKYTAIIIEPRNHKALEFVLENFTENLSNDWNIVILHGNNNIKYLYDIFNKSKILKNNLNRFDFRNLNVDNLTIKDYNNLLVSKEFYKNIPTEVFLIFQTDSIICDVNKDLINKYIKYDYVGAPWRDKVIGNGGLSLRKKSKMLEIINKCKYTNQNEDLYFSKACPEINRYFPSFDESKEFSVETVYNDKSFGVHKPWKHMKNKFIQKKNNSCKGLNKLIELNK